MRSSLPAKSLDFEQRSRNPVFACPAQETYQNQPVSTSKGSHKGAKIRVSGHIRSFVQSPINQSTTKTPRHKAICAFLGGLVAWW
jgi:hypothetical protein